MTMYTTHASRWNHSSARWADLCCFPTRETTDRDDPKEKDVASIVRSVPDMQTQRERSNHNAVAFHIIKSKVHQDRSNKPPKTFLLGAIIMFLMARVTSLPFVPERVRPAFTNNNINKKIAMSFSEEHNIIKTLPREESIHNCPMRTAFELHTDQHIDLADEEEPVKTREAIGELRTPIHPLSDSLKQSISNSFMVDERRAELHRVSATASSGQSRTPQQPHIAQPSAKSLGDASSPPYGMAQPQVAGPGASTMPPPQPPPSIPRTRQKPNNGAPTSRPPPQPPPSKYEEFLAWQTCASSDPRKRSTWSNATSAQAARCPTVGPMAILGFAARTAPVATSGPASSQVTSLTNFIPTSRVTGANRAAPQRPGQLPGLPQVPARVEEPSFGGAKWKVGWRNCRVIAAKQVLKRPEGQMTIDRRRGVITRSDCEHCFERSIIIRVPRQAFSTSTKREFVY